MKAEERLRILKDTIRRLQRQKRAFSCDSEYKDMVFDLQQDICLIRREIQQIQTTVKGQQNENTG